MNTAAPTIAPLSEPMPPTTTSTWIEKESALKADRQSQRRRGDEPYHKRAPVRAYRVEQETNAVGANAEEHHIRE
jgi:hypothetical protein